MILKFIEILLTRISGKKKDYFLRPKYDDISPYYGACVLDFGAGTGAFSHYLTTRGHRVNAVDVVPAFEQSHIDFQVFDGRVLPYADKHFDTSIAFFVFHHLNNQEELLLELKRVTSGHVIIGEDIVENRFDRFMGNIHLNTAPWAKGTDSFRDNASWLRLFEKVGFTLAAKVVIKRSEYPVYPVRRIIYVLA
jgi:SAM-dependent methyltransferase